MHEHSIHVFPTDCDMLGHVNHATMITFLEHARWALLEPHVTVHDWFRLGVFSVVRHVDIGYQAQARPGDDLVVQSGMASVGTTSFAVRQRVRRRSDGSTVAEATITFVCVDRQGEKVPVPAEWRDWFPAWREEEDA